MSDLLLTIRSLFQVTIQFGTMGILILLGIIVPIAFAVQDTRVQVNNNIEHGGLAFIRIDSFSLNQQNWVISFDHSLDTYYTVLDSLKSEVSLLRAALQNVRLNSFDDNIFAMNGHIKDMITFEFDTLSNSITEIERDIGDVKLTMSPSVSRAPRAVCDGCGSGLQWLFGLARDSDLEELNNKIDAQSKFQNELAHITESHLSILNSTIHNSKENSIQLEKIANATSHLTVKMEQLSTSFGEDLTDISRRLHIAFFVSSSVRLIEAVLQNVQLKVTELRRAWSETSNGRLSPFFLPPTVLKACLEDISKQLPDNLQFLAKPDEAHYYQFYSFSNVVTASITSNTVRLFVEIPLAHTARKFTIYKVFSIASKHPSGNLYSYNTPPKEYLAVSQDLQYFLDFDSADLQNCHGYELKICKTHWPLKRAPQNACLIAAFLGQNDIVTQTCPITIKATMNPFFYNAPNTNDWIFSVSERCRVTVICNNPNNEDVDKKLEFIEGTGTLSLGPHCDATVENSLLLPRIVGKSVITVNQTKSIIIPQLTPMWDSLNSSAALQAYIAIKSDLSNIQNSVEPVYQSMDSLIKSASGISARELDVMHQMAKARQASHDSLAWSITKFAPISISSFSLALILLAIFIARYFLVYRTRISKPNKAREPEEVNLPLTS